MTKSADLQNVYYDYKRDKPTSAAVDFMSRLWIDVRFHFHHAIEVIYVREGRLTMEVDLTKRVEVGEGEFFVLPSSILHSTFACDEGKYYLMFIPLSGLEPFFGQLGSRTFADYRCQDDQSCTLSSIVLTLHRLMKSTDPDSAVYRTLLLNALLSGLLRQTGAKPIGETASAKLMPIVDYIREHISEPFTIRTLAAHFGYTPRALSELFGSNSQKISLHDYILFTRCANARELMREGASLEEASEASGFGCLRSFYRAFTDFAGQTPGEFARSVRGKGE